MSTIADDPTMTNLQQAAKDAIAVQDACNLSGVAHSFLDAVRAVSDMANKIGEGTDWRNNHPIIRLYVDKLASLCGMQGNAGHINYSAASAACDTLAEGDK